MRFCTSELKTKIIASALKRRFPDRPILNVTGIRRQESAQRRAKPVSAIDRDITTLRREAFVWNAIIEWPVEQVWKVAADIGLAPHEAYEVYGSSRVSCVFCIMSSLDDLRAAGACVDNQNVYRILCDLEIRSTFGFQGNRWLADIAAHLLEPSARASVSRAKFAARERLRLEARIPSHLLYVAGWPTAIPNRDDAELLARIRRQIASLLGIEADYLTGSAVRDRYADLIDARTRKPRKDPAHGENCD
jgi:3'-phosphoadenosine 5'-phosphosulfate sulfotransferase (PAPS reductase)/FAD synthetase